MKILNHVDLGKAFESLKKTLIEVENQVREDKPTVLDTGMKYANAYGRLSAAVEIHIAMNTDTGFGFLDNARKAAENGSNDIPTLARYEDNPDDIPESLFTQPNGYGGLTD